MLTWSNICACREGNLVSWHCSVQVIQPTAHLVDGTVPGLLGSTHFWQDTPPQTHTPTPEGMSYLRLTSQNEHIRAGVYKPGHTLGYIGRQHSVQRVRHGWHSGHRLPLAQGGCISHTCSHKVSRSHFLVIKPSSSQYRPWLRRDGGSALHKPTTHGSYQPLSGRN